MGLGRLGPPGSFAVLPVVPFPFDFLHVLPVGVQLAVIGRVDIAVSPDGGGGVAADKVGTVKDSAILFSVLLCPLIKSPNRCTRTPPPSILLSLAMLSP